jgi:hypothetical protein
VAFELKIEEFEPAHLGQLEFYLEALDRDVRKPHERLSIDVLLKCPGEMSRRLPAGDASKHPYTSRRPPNPAQRCQIVPEMSRGRQIVPERKE